jgi:predicted transcriptional regulator
VGLREDFIKAYSNIPLNLRKEIIVVLDGEPLTWNAAYVEVYNETEKGERLLNKLEEMSII